MTNPVKSKLENVVEKEEEISLLDLPDLTLECIFERLPPNGLCSMAAVCSSLREKCTSDHLLGSLYMKQKWGALISSAAYREWQCYTLPQEIASLLENSRKRDFGEIFKDQATLWNSSKGNEDNSKLGNSSAMSSISWYLSLETGEVWFPAPDHASLSLKVQNGHVGFMLSCYDAEVSYDCSTNTFRARYPSQGANREDIEWNRLRAPADTPHMFFISAHCSAGWWYGVVGHLESCSGSKLNCHCHASETVVLEFKQYTPGSRWRQAVINRKDHREVGNEADGFYGGIRKLYSDKEISVWKRHWPSCTLNSTKQELFTFSLFKFY
ncbi:hypothetical protein HAX54_026535 [Datura stramonium]|uniref:F-box domain-containing protein n=1 Tax=Datura stramonium TaxID=4076 RepID=A0ABS8S7Y1_DATST|nr:hypothetical protein [Datura stramonium]